MNKAPTKVERELSFTVGNIFNVATWFIAQHKLEFLRKYLSLSVVVAFGLQTGPPHGATRTSSPARMAARF